MGQRICLHRDGSSSLPSLQSGSPSQRHSLEMQSVLLHENSWAEQDFWQLNSSDPSVQSDRKGGAAKGGGAKWESQIVLNHVGNILRCFAFEKAKRLRIKRIIPKSFKTSWSPFGHGPCLGLKCILLSNEGASSANMAVSVYGNRF